jgi:predicted SAM-dependent methyltransferase
MNFITDKLELGSGKNPTPGYIHSDINSFEGIDIISSPWEIELPDSSLNEILALGVMEHLTYSDFAKALNNIYRMLKPGGIFLFDVPDLLVWSKYLVDHESGLKTPCDLNHILSTLYGWQRWPGDEHKSGWIKSHLIESLNKANFLKIEFNLDNFLQKGIKRNRMTRNWDAHFYVSAIK